MFEHQEPTAAPADVVASVTDTVPASPASTDTPAAEVVNGTGSTEASRWHAEAGRKGARRVHQLIQEGKLYEKEHGLKSGRQRLRQLIELGKLYEQEHGLRPARSEKQAERLSRPEREELLSTLLHCLVRLAKPSFRAELTRLTEVLQASAEGHAA